MKVKTEITKTLINDNGREYRVNHDISFCYQGHEYIVYLKALEDSFIVGTNVEKDGKKICDAMIFNLSEISNCNRVSEGYY